MADKFTARVNLRLTQETYDAYKEVADLLETDATSLIRLFVDGAVPAVQAMGQAARSVVAGQPLKGVEVLERFADKVVTDSQFYHTQTEAFGEEMRSKVSQSA